MSQVALNYRESPLSEDHGHGGSLKAGDRVPDMPVLHRTESGWKSARLFELLNPSHYTLLVAGPPSDAAPEGLHGAVPQERFVEIAPSGDEDEGEKFEGVFGKAVKAVLVRPRWLCRSDQPRRVSCLASCRIPRQMGERSAGCARLTRSPTPRHRSNSMIDPNSVQILFADPPARNRLAQRDQPARGRHAIGSGSWRRVGNLLKLPMMHRRRARKAARNRKSCLSLPRKPRDRRPFRAFRPVRFSMKQTEPRCRKTAGRPLIISGFATEVVVLHAVRAALEARLQRPCPGRCLRWHVGTNRGMPHFVRSRPQARVTTSVVTLVTALAPDAASEPGRSAFAMLQTLRLA